MLKVGSKVQHESEDGKGFITRKTGVVTWIDKSLATPSGCVIVEITHIRCEHKNHPELGRDLPVPQVEYGRLIAFDAEECEEINDA